jgi:hypothetical protein
VRTDNLFKGRSCGSRRGCYRLINYFTIFEKFIIFTFFKKIFGGDFYTVFGKEQSLFPGC